MTASEQRHRKKGHGSIGFAYLGSKGSAEPLYGL
jgi:hypothetical protein